MSHSSGLDLTNLLLGLAWMGELDRRQIKRLWFVDRSQSTVEKALSRLHDEDNVWRAWWTHQVVPLPQRRVRAVWAALHRVVALLWATLKLPWRTLRAAFDWYEWLRYQLGLGLVALVLLFVAGSVLFILHPRSGFAGRVPSAAPLTAAPVAENATWPTAEVSVPAMSCPPARVTAARVNLRTGPGLEEMVLRKLQAGELLSVRDCCGHTEDGYTWWQVAGEDGIVGWATTHWLEETEARP